MARRPTRGQVMEHMRKAMVLLFPSTWYEVMPLTLIEACATGLPVAASALGVMTEIVEHGTTGLHFKAENAIGTGPQSGMVLGASAAPRRNGKRGPAPLRRYLHSRGQLSPAIESLFEFERRTARDIVY